MLPDIIQLGPIPLHSFGLMMVLAFLSAARLLALALESRGEDPALAEVMVFWAAIGGIVGARVTYLLSFPEEFLREPIRAIFSGAGFVFYGGLIGGALAVWILLLREKKSFFKFADLTAPALAIGYAVGRLGCQLSGDGDYGEPSTLPWAMSYPLGVVPTDSLVHPTPVYETLGSLLTCAILIHLLNRREWRPGAVFGIYLALSAVSRFLVEIVRVEPRVWGEFTEAQLISIPLLIAGTVLFISQGKSAAVVNGAAN